MGPSQPTQRRTKLPVHPPVIVVTAALLPPVVRSPVFAIRKRAVAAIRLALYVKQRVMNADEASRAT